MKLWLGMWLLGWGALAGAESEFKIDPGLLDKFYQAEMQKVHAETRHSGGAIEVTPFVSWVQPSELSLTNNYFTVPYAADGAKFPLFQLALSTPFFSSGGFHVDGQVRIGYTYREATYEVQSQSGLVLKDYLHLHWLPLTGAARVSYAIPGLPMVKPSLALGAGAQWLNQSGKLDGIEQSFWVPFYSVSPAVTLFDQSEKAESFFGGVTIGLTFSRSLGATQVVRYTSIDFGTTLVL